MSNRAQGPQGPFRSFSMSSNVSVNSSASITRVALGPIQAMGTQSVRGNVLDQGNLYYQSSLLRDRLYKIEGMESYLALAFEEAEQAAEQQALALSQIHQSIGRGFDGKMLRASLGSTEGSVRSESSSTSTGTGWNNQQPSNSFFTFTAGVLPAHINVDPATHLWKLFQQGAPLCVIFNSVVKDYSIPVIASDDMRVCKKSVYDFLIAVKMHLNFEDEVMFTISNVFLNSTHDYIKVLKAVNKVLALEGPEEEEISESVKRLLLNDTTTPDNRAKVLREIIETERSYVLDLQLLLDYKDEIQDEELMTNDQIHVLFPNLSEILDFQRRFLNGLECNLNVPSKYQRIGSVFIHAASGPFLAYEPWTTGQLAAIELINKEHQTLERSNLLDPGFQLQSFILKPVQRLCKYPLLLKELLKTYPEEGSDNPAVTSNAYSELALAHSAMKEVANEVNEAQRRSENVGCLLNLMERVQSWRGFDIREQGELLYHTIVSVKNGDKEREYFAYLFDRIIFFFIEVGSGSSKEKEPKKSILPTRKKASSSTANILETLNQARTKSKLELKGRVYILEIYNIQSSNTSGYYLGISWAGRKENGTFTLRYRTEEVRDQWENCLRILKANEMDSQLFQKLKELRGSQASLSSHYAGYDPEIYTRMSNDSTSLRHHSSSSTLSMMRQRSKSSADPNASNSFSTSLTGDRNTSIFSAGSASASASRSGSGSASLPIRLNFQKSVLPDIISVPVSITYSELRSTILSKLTSAFPGENFQLNKLKYKDEDGDYVVIESNDDWTLALDLVNSSTDTNDDQEGVLTLWVS